MEGLLSPIQPYLPPILSLGEQSDVEGIGVTCEMRQYERITNAKGEKVTLRAGTSRRRAGLGTSSHDRWSHSSALVLTTDLSNSDCPWSQLEIQSPYIKAAMKECVPGFENFDILNKSIILENEPWCLFHHRQNLINYHHRCAKNNQHTEAEHIQFLLDHMFDKFSAEIRHYNNNFVQKPVYLQPGLDFLRLWMAFVPGQLVYVPKTHLALERVQERVFRLKSMSRCSCTRLWCSRYGWALILHSIKYDGTDFGYGSTTVYIDPYEGVRAIQDLNVIPLECFPDHEGVKEKLISRGKRYTGLVGPHYKESFGVAELLSDTRDLTFTGEDDYFPLRSKHINGRIMIDHEAFNTARPSHEVFTLCTEKHFRVGLKQHLSMTEEELILCDSYVAGYSLQDKKWGWFKVDSIQDVQFNNNAFKSLIFSETYKSMILSLVTSHANKDSQFDDVIKGKGKGLVFLLHGAPGTGKTLTAESIADHTKMPLLKIDAGSIGSSSEGIEESLASIFIMAERWNAVALLDEADVFFEKRNTLDLERNMLIAAFLRVLEYFEGVLFLTTNRINVFDPAFKSRIHLALHYPTLDSGDRHSIWRNFLTGPGVDASPELLKDQGLNTIVDTKLNGRQIKNIVHIANSLAVSQGTQVTYQHLELALGTISTFDQYFESGTADEEEKSVDSGDCKCGKGVSRPRKRRRMESSDSEAFHSA